MVSKAEYRWIVEQGAPSDPAELSFDMALGFAEELFAQYPKSLGGEFQKQAVAYAIHYRFSDLKANDKFAMQKLVAQMRKDSPKTVQNLLIKNCLNRPVIRDIGKTKGL